jgi:type IV secretory pathway TraG/TraD family ATPase VirD4
MKTDTSDSYQGYEIQKHKTIMAVKMYSQLFVSCLFVQFLLVLLFIQLMVPLLHRELALYWPIARLEQSLGINQVFLLHATADRLKHWPHDKEGNVRISGRDLVPQISYKAVFTAPKAHLFRACLCSFVAWILFPLGRRFFSKAAVKIKQDEHIRGARLVTEKEIVVKNDRTGILAINRIIIPDAVSKRHILIVGQTGSGKSTVLEQHRDKIQKMKRRAIVNDFKGELVRRFYRPEIDLILNPLDARGLGWTIFNELKSKADLTAIAGSLIPQAKGEDRFWSAAAQDVFRGLMAGCYQFNKRTNADLWKAITSSKKEIAEMCRATSSGLAGYSYIQDASSKQTAGVIAVLMSYVAWLEFAPDGPFSLRKWAAAHSSGRTIFITDSEEVSNIMRPLLSLFADLAGKRLLALPENEEPGNNIYLILDEMGNMQRLPTVKRLLTAGRSKGIVVEVGIPDLASIESIYGREDAHTIINSCCSKLIMNLGDPEAAKFFSELFSEEECYQEQTVYSISQDDSKGGENHSRIIRTRKVVMPAEIRGLSVGQGYFMLPGGNPALVTIPYTDSNKRSKIHQAFILRKGLSLNELENKDYEITAGADAVKNGPVPEELKQQVTDNVLKRTQEELQKAAEDNLGFENGTDESPDGKEEHPHDLPPDGGGNPLGKE